MRKFVSGLLCAAITVSLFTVMSGGVSAAGAAVDPNWKYETMVDFEELQPGLQFGGKDDTYSLYCADLKNAQAKVNKGGYNNSACFYMTQKNDKKGDYAQPLINAMGFKEKKKEFKGATEFWMWVDFSKIKFDEVGLQMRIIENDYNKDGTEATNKLSQISPGKDKPVYIQSGNSWKELKVNKKYILPVENMKEYKGFVRIPLSSLVFNDAGSNLDEKINLECVSQIWFIFNYPNNSKDEYLAFDQFMFVGPLKSGGKSISKFIGGSTGTTATKATTPETKATSADTTAAPTETTAATTTTIQSTTTTTQAATTTTTAKDTPANIKPVNNNWVLPVVIIAIVVLAGGGAALYYFVIRKKIAEKHSGNTEE